MSGIHRSYVYLGNVHTFFAWHREDMNLYSVNHLLFGKEKIWYCIRPADTWRVMEFVREQYVGEKLNCVTPLQHKSCWFDPYILLKLNIDVFYFKQKVGDIMITPPGGLHSGFNTGLNVAESVNFMTWDLPGWQRSKSAMEYYLASKCESCNRHVYFDVPVLLLRFKEEADFFQKVIFLLIIFEKKKNNVMQIY